MPQKNRTVKGALGGVLGLVGLSAVAGLLVAASVTPVLAMTGIAGSQALTIFDKLPANLQVNRPMEQSTIYAMNADKKPVELASFYEQNRIPVTYDQINPVVYDAILSSEDKDYFSHGGINVGATAKALVDNLRGTDDRGASTITQQYVKNVLIQECEQEADPASGTYADDLQQCWLDATNAKGAEGIERKLQEMRYALQIEKEYSKNDILLGYLNIANFGGTVYGIESAANYYFSTTAAKLTAAQAATIAGMVQNPNLYRIDKPAGTWTDKDGVAHNTADDGYAMTLERRHYVLQRMLTLGKITQAQYDEADASPITPAITQPTQGCVSAGNVARSAYFCEYVKSVVLTDPAFGADETARKDLLRQGGLKIYTTMNIDIQTAAAESMANLVPAGYDNQYFGAAGVSLETGTGRVLAITQNTTFSETVTGDQAYSALVFATDKAHGGSNGFSVGSTYKLFTLIDWLEKGHSVRETLNASNRVFRNFKCGDDPIINTTKIDNFNRAGGYTGSVMRFTADSLNSGYLAMAEKLDLCDINKVADRMGVTLASGKKTTDDPAVPYDILGSKYISPLAMAGAYATVANKGIYCTPKSIDRVVDGDGNELPVPESKCTQVIDPAVAATAAFALQGVMNGGTGAKANNYDGVPVIGKTGTHEKWGTMMIESSTKVTTAVWVGRSEGQASILNQYWNGTALNEMRYWVAKDMQRAANNIYGGDRFPEPDNKLIRQVLTDVPDVVGQTVEQATATLKGAGFQVTVGAPVDSDKATNIVVAQDPAGKAPSGATITLSPSNGQGATVPDITGQSQAEAQNALFGAGFTSIDFDGSCNGNGAKVASTTPAANSAANKSTTIKVACK
ncbi:penicillin-binding protein [Microbacterium hydrocarbonoxydans]|uniref:Membrane carboxypeptidase (Penicillin-binding protein) n=1 Tax=Microbacterium hydrocarbonoxydans TaxID=273678 RepID=A0A1H4JZC9_9MICO|nr:penicillin-binding protein [Microbacterium hydrocarbonoxydans]SEB51651.1 Membrane carboxypeptidase (penicillin-binding protein) [Microbacterium hydrocarbonoxydans]